MTGARATRSWATTCWKIGVSTMPSRIHRPIPAMTRLSQNGTRHPQLRNWSPDIRPNTPSRPTLRRPRSLNEAQRDRENRAPDADLLELRQRTDEVAELNRGLEARVAEQVEELGRVGRLFCDLRGYTAFTETPRYQGLLDDIYRGGGLPDDPSIYLHHPTATDPSLAPSGHSTFYALAPVPHLGRLPLDWGQEGECYRERILATLEERLMPGLRGRITTIFHYTPQDFAADLGAHLGSAFSLEPRLTQSAWFRVHNRDDVVRNLFFVGAGTHPGAGIPGVVQSAKATAGLMLADLA
jgi:hypothetical protein